jgi:hypothetical protein
MNSIPNRSLKIQLGSELRKILELPKSLEEFRRVLLTLFNRDNFLLNYQDT